MTTVRGAGNGEPYLTSFIMAGYWATLPESFQKRDAPGSRGNAGKTLDAWGATIRQLVMAQSEVERGKAELAVVRYSNSRCGCLPRSRAHSVPMHALDGWTMDGCLEHGCGNFIRLYHPLCGGFHPDFMTSSWKSKISVQDVRWGPEIAEIGDLLLVLGGRCEKNT